MYENELNMDCPVCNISGLPEGTMECPGCKSDLTAYRVLDELEQSISKKSKTINWLVIAVVLLLLASAITVFWVQQSDGSGSGSKNEYIHQITQLQQTKEVIEQRADSLNQALAACNQGMLGAVKEKVVEYTVKPGETLCQIARKFYGDCVYYHKIIIDNKIDKPNMIYPGMVLQLRIVEN